MDPQQVLSSLSFGKVDAETDDKLSNCFIGTDILKQALLARHSLLIGGKGSGKSALFRLLSQDTYRLTQLIQSNFNEIYSIPAYGIHSDEYLTYTEIQEINPQSIDDFKYFWQLYFGLKTAATIANCPRMQDRVNKSNSPIIKNNFHAIVQLLTDIGLLQKGQNSFSFHNKIKELFSFRESTQNTTTDSSKIVALYNKSKTGLNIISFLDLIDKILKESNCLVWILVDQIDLLYLDNLDRRKKAITALVQLLIEYSNRFSNINLKVFLRTDIYKELQIVNKSHLISMIIELKWTESLLLKLFVTRAVYDKNVRIYCENILKENLDVMRVIAANDEFIMKIFYTLFDNKINTNSKNVIQPHSWIMKRLVDGLGLMYPRELIHLGNQTVSKQREINKNNRNILINDNESIICGSLLGSRAVKLGFEEVSKYRCDTYLYAEFPHLSKHFDKFRGKEKDKFSREELMDMFSNVSPDGNDAIHAVYETGLLRPSQNQNVDACRSFSIPYLYRSGFGIINRRNKNTKAWVTPQVL
jgi:hypothetical protein